MAYGETGAGKTHTMLGSCILKRKLGRKRDCSKSNRKNIWHLKIRIKNENVHKLYRNI